MIYLIRKDTTWQLLYTFLTKVLDTCARKIYYIRFNTENLLVDLRKKYHI
jgi:hypothetical protein